MQFWLPDDEHMCSKHVEAWNKLIVKQQFCASSSLITEINILRCTVIKTSKWITIVAENLNLTFIDFFGSEQNYVRYYLFTALYFPFLSERYIFISENTQRTTNSRALSRYKGLHPWNRERVGKMGEIQRLERCVRNQLEILT